MRYWDLTAEERAALTQEQIEAMCRVELMEAGVLSPDPPDLVDEAAVAVETTTYFAPKQSGTYGDNFGIAFETAEQAAQFCALKPLKIHREWRVGSEHQYAKPLTNDLEVSPVELMTEADYNRKSADLQRAHEAKEANSKARREYEKAMEAVSKATEGVWSDWHDCRAVVRELNKIRADFKEYAEMCGGDETKARFFLGKAYCADRITEAIGAPEPMADEPAPEEATA